MEATWLEDIASIRKDADEAQAKANEKMTAYLAKKNKVSVYSVGDKVLVQNPNARTKQGKRILDKMPAFSGKIIEQKGLRYKVQYENDGGSYSCWFSVNQVTSTTKDTENKRKKISSEEGKIQKRTENGERVIEKKKSNEELMLALRDRLASWDLVPVETEKDGNCFFRAVSQMVYGEDRHYQYVRQITVDWIRENMDEIQPYVIGQFESPDAYVNYMSMDQSWADDAAVRAAAEAMEIEIQLISAENDYVPVNRPSNSPASQTIFIGLIQDYHFVSTADRRIPQQMQNGGTTSDGVTLEHTDSIDNPLTWLFELISKNKVLFDRVLKARSCAKLNTVMSKIKSGNSADGKKEVGEWLRKRKYPVHIEKISFKTSSDSDILHQILLRTNLDNMRWCLKYDACKNECDSVSTSQNHAFSRLSLQNVLDMIEPCTRSCATCKDSLNCESDLVVASPFFIIHGSASDTELWKYPDTFTFNSAGKDITYTKGFVGLKYPRREHNSVHYSSYFKSNENFWYHFDSLNPRPIRRVISLQDEVLLMSISCVVYMCLSLLSVFSEKDSEKKKKKTPAKKNRQKVVDVENNLKQTSYVQLVAADQIALYLEYDRNTHKDPANPNNLQKVTKMLINEGLKYPITLAVSKESGKAYVYDGNHRLTALLNTGAKWVPVLVSYYFMRDAHDPSLNYIPVHSGRDLRKFDWPSYPTPDVLGFMVKHLTD